MFFANVFLKRLETPSVEGNPKSLPTLGIYIGFEPGGAFRERSGAIVRSYCQGFRILGFKQPATENSVFCEPAPLQRLLYFANY